MESILKNTLPDGKFSNVKRSHSNIMKGVKSKGGKTTEARFRAALVKNGISGWVLNEHGIKGTPDFFFPKLDIAIFLDGCFWHGCNRCGHVPKTNREFWSTKIRRNIERDKKTTSILRKQGLFVLRFWEHDISLYLRGCIMKLKRTIVKANSLKTESSND